MFKKVMLLSLIIACCACQSSPRKEYFALSSTPSDISATEVTSVQQLIGVGPIQIPEYLQHNKMGYWRTSQQLALLDNQYWAEPLEQGIARVIALELQNKHDQWRVIKFPWSRSQRPAYSLRMDILRLDAYGDHAILEATADIVDASNKRVIASRHIKSRVDATASASSIAVAYSELLHHAAESMAPLIPKTSTSP